MMSDSMFDILMEIRRVDQQLAKENLKVQESERELLNLNKSIKEVKELQLKAMSILKDTERKAENTNSELADIHKTVETFMEHLDEYFEFTPESEHEDATMNIDALREERDDLKDRVSKERTKIDELAMKVNEVDLKISIQKVKSIFKMTLCAIIYNFLHLFTFLHRRKTQLRYCDFKKS